MNGKCIFINISQISFKIFVSVIGFLQNSYVILKMKLWAVLGIIPKTYLCIAVLQHSDECLIKPQMWL